MIEVKNISKSYGEKNILNNINLKIPEGKITALVGSNGAGKSTLLSIISRLLQQDNGVILLNEENINHYKNRVLAQKLSVLKQFNSVGIRITVWELVAFGRFPYSENKLTVEDEKKIDEAIDFLNLKSISDSYLDELSGGQKQRAYLAMVVAQDTQYILLDEPLNNLDMKHSVQMMKTLCKLSQKLGKTIVIVLHDINFAASYSDYIVALKNGKVCYFDETNTIIEEKTLCDIFEIPFSISIMNNKKICNYYNII
ncbi:MAG: ATP-binding cassette domain-containing protein [Flavobacteriaceae bacterium]|jgi:iron complex transport system ATP-binding protein|uniref:iron ABC transporter ATP-binding protein n=1 Tax=Elizabethkingia ursingii TaxID=1756150 RepID=UPI002010D3FB|nr:ATP-binding cassette domain-containing protein [Elizabethkingia ursingii]MCL1670864.1 ATP-binding cassette domain-containing protein [Elizabethkingia ursingii]MDR2228822.1 ATP-binding cassette domain-containing protein [Flavobacteriaceae bacterium]